MLDPLGPGILLVVSSGEGSNCSFTPGRLKQAAVGLLGSASIFERARYRDGSFGPSGSGGYGDRGCCCLYPLSGLILPSPHPSAPLSSSPRPPEKLVLLELTGTGPVPALPPPRYFQSVLQLVCDTSGWQQAGTIRALGLGPKGDTPFPPQNISGSITK